MFTLVSLAIALVFVNKGEKINKQIDEALDI